MESVISVGKTYLYDHGPGRLEQTVIENKLITVPITYIPYEWVITQIKTSNYKIKYGFVENPSIDLKVNSKKCIRIQEFGFLLERST